MKAIVNGIWVEGTLEEIAKLTRLAKPQQSSKTISPHDCDDTGPGCHICAGLGPTTEPASYEGQCCQGGAKSYGRCHGCQRR